jgi:putative intracellular protease/amidase
MINCDIKCNLVSKWKETKMLKIFKKMSVVLIFVAYSITVGAQELVEVKTIGELKQLATSQLNGKVPLKSLLQNKPLYGLGMPTGLDAELLVLANKPHVGGFRNMAYQYPISNSASADNPNISFMVYSYVDKWQSFILPDDVQTYEKLESYLPQLAQKHGLNIEKPIPFLIAGDADFLNWFVVNGYGNKNPSPQASFMRGRFLGGSNDVSFEGLGFYSTKHQGVFTSAKNNMHIHFKTIPQKTAESVFVGHLDGNIQLKKGAVIQLPVIESSPPTASNPIELNKEQVMKQKKQVLIVVTSHAELGDTKKPTGLYFDELATPYYVLSDENVEVTIASPLGGKTPIVPSSLGDAEKRPANVSRFMADQAAMQKLHNAIPLVKINPANFDGIFLAGGHGTMFDLPQNKDLANILGHLYDNDKVIAAVCHGPAGLVSAKRADGKSILYGKRVNGFTNSEEEKVELTNVVPFLLETKMIELGGKFEKAADFAEHVVVDGNLITGQNPASAAKVAEQFFKQLN